MIKTCDVCENLYETKSSRSRYCSSICRNKSVTLRLNEKVIRICRNCTKEYLGYTTTVYCSKECYHDYNRNKDSRRKEWANNSYHRTKQGNFKRYLLKYAKARAVKRSLPFSITEEHITLPEVCPYFNRPFILFDKKWGPSIDRIIPEKGYTPENIQIVSCLANSMKWTATEDELLSFADGIYRHHK